MTCLTLPFLHNVYESDSKRKSHLLQISLLKWRAILSLRLHHCVKIRRQKGKLLKYLWKLLVLYPGILFVMNSRYFQKKKKKPFNLILQWAKLTRIYNKAELLNTWNTQTLLIKDSAELCKHLCILAKGTRLDTLSWIWFTPKKFLPTVLVLLHKTQFDREYHQKIVMFSCIQPSYPSSFILHLISAFWSIKVLL